MQTIQKQNTIGYIELATLLFIWIIVFFSPALVQHNNLGTINWGVILNSWKRLFPFFLLSLINHFILVPLLFFNTRKLWYILSAVITLFLFSFMLKWINLKNAPARNPVYDQRFTAPLPHDGLRPDRMPLGPNHDQRPGALPPPLNSALVALMILGFDTGLRTVFRLSRSEQEKTLLEKEMARSELAFLRSQVSPHFFMNTLNNIHALIDFNTTKAKETVIRLSALMRYLLYDSESEKIPLEHELSFIRSYLELMKLRISDDVDVTLLENIKDAKREIPPLLFTSLIENAFKHGVSYRKDSFIRLEFSTNEQILTFKIENSVVRSLNGLEDKHSGIGLENTKKRLDILYNNKYSMNIKSDDNVFSIMLIIPL